jgi:hypothetical protein
MKKERARENGGLVVFPQAEKLNGSAKERVRASNVIGKE